MTYQEKLKDPRWIEFRKQVKKEISNKCGGCGCEEHPHFNSFDLHHITYEHGKEPWEYNHTNFVLMCEVCHQRFHANNKILKELLIYPPFLSHGFSKGIIEIITTLLKMDMDAVWNVSRIVDICKSLNTPKNYDYKTV